MIFDPQSPRWLSILRQTILAVNGQLRFSISAESRQIQDIEPKITFGRKVLVPFRKIEPTESLTKPRESIPLRSFRLTVHRSQLFGFDRGGGFRDRADSVVVWVVLVVSSVGGDGEGDEIGRVSSRERALGIGPISFRLRDTSAHSRRDVRSAHRFRRLPVLALVYCKCREPIRVVDFTGDRFRPNQK